MKIRLGFYKECEGCKYDSRQYAKGVSCEYCKRNPTFADEYEPVEKEEGKKDE